MKRISALALATVTTLTILATSATAPAYAGKHERHLAAGIFLGLVGGGIIAHELRRDRRDYGHAYHSDRDYDGYFDDDYDVGQRHPRRARKLNRSARWQRHVRRCNKRYRTYDERSDTFIGNDGREHQCRL